MPKFKISDRWVGDGEQVYFIADISANHDGQLDRALELIRLAKEAGAHGAKFQYFRAHKIVSRYGFESLGKQLSHQSEWRKSVFEVYQDASLSWEWTEALKQCCQEVGIDFFSAPYDLEAVDMLSPHVPVWKIGSGDITWPQILEKVADQGQPVILATGASPMEDVQRAVQIILGRNQNLALLQCNTNYTGSLENFSHLHLNVLPRYRQLFPEVVLGLSDHTPGHAAVLGAVALGARIIEKHFTDDNGREGPDHPFSMTPATWREMVARTRELERALGKSEKFVAGNEQETVVLQRRCLRAVKDLEQGHNLEVADLEALRPAPRDAVFPYELEQVLGRRLRTPMRAGENLTWDKLEQPSSGPSIEERTKKSQVSLRQAP